MKKISSLTSTATSDGLFTNGSVASGVSPTILDAGWFNTVQNELVAVVQGAGLTLDATNDAQVLAAIKSLFNAGRLLNIQIFTSSGTYTPTTGAKKAVARIVGAGGGGGGCPATTTGQQSTARGGASGAYAEVLFTISASTYAITIGAAGAGGLRTSGSGGGASAIAGIVSCPGGAGGAVGTATSSTLFVSGISHDTTLPTVSSGTLLYSLPGQSGDGAVVVGVTSGLLKGGAGGNSPFGFGGVPGTGTAGGAAVGKGGGGGGCSQYGDEAGDSGGSGSAGLIIIAEYA